MTVWFNLATSTKRLGCQEDSIGGLGTAEILLKWKVIYTVTFFDSSFMKKLDENQPQGNFFIFWTKERKKIFLCLAVNKNLKIKGPPDLPT